MMPVVAKAVVRLASLLVPGGHRSEWLEEWNAELTALECELSNERSGLPSLITYALGAAPHAFWMRMEGWTVDSLLQDLRYSTRVLVRSSRFTLVAAVTLARRTVRCRRERRSRTSGFGRNEPA
mgnify:CR=1 FL=1|jgi:hypothetical protein